MVERRKTKGRHLLREHCGVIAYAKLMGVNSERVRVAMEAEEIVPDLVGKDGYEMIDLKKYGHYVFPREAENRDTSKDKLSCKRKGGENE